MGDNIMKTLIIIFALLLVQFDAHAQINAAINGPKIPSAGYVKANSTNYATGLPLTDKGRNLINDSTVWTAFNSSKDPGATTSNMYPDSIFVWTRANQTNDSVQAYICVDLAPSLDSVKTNGVGGSKDKQNAPGYTRITVDSISTSTYTTALPSVQWRVAKVCFTNHNLQGATFYRVVVTQTNGTVANLKVGNGTATSANLKPRVWVVPVLVYGRR